MSKSSLHRFHIPAELLQAEEVVLPAAVAGQLFRVLRLRPGARIALFCGDGAEAVAVVERLGPGEGSARIVERRSPAVELGCRLEMGVAVLKGEKLDWVVQKLTELGVSRIHLLQTERTVVSAGEERWPRRLERYTRIAVEAAEQSGRVRVPELMEPRPWQDVLEYARDSSGTAESVSNRLEPDSHRFEPVAGLRCGSQALERCLRCLVLDPGAGSHLLEALRPCPPRLLLLVGPEGGLAEAEIAAALAAGAVPARLGPRILRAETAAIAAASLVASMSDTQGTRP